VGTVRTLLFVYCLLLGVIVGYWLRCLFTDMPFALRLLVDVCYLRVVFAFGTVVRCAWLAFVARFDLTWLVTFWTFRSALVVLPFADAVCVCQLRCWRCGCLPFFDVGADRYRVCLCGTLLFVFCVAMPCGCYDFTHVYAVHALHPYIDVFATIQPCLLRFYLHAHLLLFWCISLPIGFLTFLYRLLYRFIVLPVIPVQHLPLLFGVSCSSPVPFAVPYAVLVNVVLLPFLLTRSSFVPYRSGDLLVILYLLRFRYIALVIMCLTPCILTVAIG